MGIKLIGITGLARSGKDTIANILRDEHGFLKLPMAGPLKMAAAPLFNWPEAMVFEDDFKLRTDGAWGFTVREGFQRLGDAMKREFGEDFWVRRWAHEYERTMTQYSVVVPDVRFETEAKVLRDLGGLIIHVKRDGAGLKDERAKHCSESGIAFGDRDIEICNNGTLGQLETEVLKAVLFIEEYGQETGLRNFKF